METEGWILLLVSWIGLSALVYFCIGRVLREEAAERERETDGDPPASGSGV